MTSMELVVADTNVLFPFSIVDVLLGMPEDGIHEFVWSNDLLDKWDASSWKIPIGRPNPLLRSRLRFASFLRSGEIWTAS